MRYLAIVVALAFFLPARVIAEPGLVPRSNPPVLHLHSEHTLQRRDVIGENGQQGSGYASVGTTANRQSFYTVIKVGEINFRVALDTASSDLWIVSTRCKTSHCSGVPPYPLAEYHSPTFSALNANSTEFKASYADGSTASGFVAQETVQLANLTVAGQHFGLVTDSNVTLTDQVSGIFGLGFPRLSSISRAADAAPFFTTLAYRGLLDYPLFALSLTRNHTGSLTLGAIDSSVVNDTSRIAWNRVASFPPFLNEANQTVATYLQWAIPLASFSIGETSLNPTPSYPSVGGGRSLALIDAGAAGISGPVQDVSKIFAQIEGSRIVDTEAGQWVVPCDTLVPMTFTFGNTTYTLLPEDYIIGPASGNPNLCLSWPRASPPHPDGIDWQLGAPFLRTVYSIFSFGINTKEPPIIGFYPLRNATEIASLVQNQTPESLSSYLASMSATVTTTLPNVIHPTPTHTPPPYALNTTISAPVGALVSSGLATHTYSAIFGTRTASYNTSAIPTITPEPSVTTSVGTDPAGQVTTATFTKSTSVPLGLPGSWNAGRCLRDALPTAVFSWAVSSLFLRAVLSWTDLL